MRITEAGAVGIGTTAPEGTSARLHVAADVATNIVFQGSVTSNDGVALVGRKSRGTRASPTAVVNGDNVINIYANAYDGSNWITSAKIDFEIDGVVGTNDMPGRIIFNTTADGASTTTERMRITSAGRVGIGTATPGHQLDVRGGNIALTTNNTFIYGILADASTNVAMMGMTSGDTLQIGQSSGIDDIIFYPGTSAAMIINDSGNVGIGTTTPDGKLHIRSGAGTFPTPHADHDELIIENTNDAGISIITCNAYQGGIAVGDTDQNRRGFLIYDNGTSLGSGADSWTFGTAAAMAMVIDSSQNVGIGTTVATDESGYKSIQMGPQAALIWTCAAALSSDFALGQNIYLSGGGWKHAFNDAASFVWQNSGQIVFYTADCAAAGAAFNGGARMRIDETGNVCVVGALSKGSGSFSIDHPLESKKDTHRLVHSFIEGPQADLIYSGIIQLSGGAAIVNVDTEAGMTDGTFVSLNRCTRVFTTNESNWDAVRGSVTGNTLTIESNVASSAACISWMVVGERCDQHMMDTGWTDEDGKVIVEPVKDILEPAPPE